MAKIENIELLELDPLLPATALDNVSADIGLPAFRERQPGDDGRGVAIAVIDSGIDVDHPT